MSVRMRLSIAIVILACVTLSAATDIKLATLVPANTSWHKALLDMGNTWNKDTAGGGTPTQEPFGVHCEEITTIKKNLPEIANLQSAFITPPGLDYTHYMVQHFSMPI